MGLDSYHCGIVLDNIRKLQNALGPKTPPLKVLCLGYQDILVMTEFYNKWFGPEAVKELAPRPNSDSLFAIHGVNAQGVEVIPTLTSFFDLIGNVDLDIIDFQEYEGSEIILDLGKPVPQEFEKKYDVIIDGGTIEHVFNISQAFHNIAKMTKLGGIVYHGIPLNILNHGFYNINPTLLYDFYGDNGFSIEHFDYAFKVNSDTVIQWKTFPPPHMDRFKCEAETISCFIAKRQKDVAKLIDPIQGRYRNKENWK